MNKRVEYRFIPYHNKDKALQYRIHPDDFKRKWYQFWKRNPWKMIYRYIPNMERAWDIDPPDNWWIPVFNSKYRLDTWKENYPDTDSLSKLFKSHLDMYYKDLIKYRQLHREWNNPEY